ncbi:CRISPR-associated helicase/endonuclease Cas3 [Schaalia vaccimaxillae]|uniref:CRISPR-associated helicase/endonuclease Cas3 n=1 Tax=Schaalia vaccimaxillae TaxID=183916 RepID=UPI0003B512F9|nr:CRISPR-associated helicase/endonuclease Cas3 [Schaalia vaccimaxillae]
MLSPAARRVWAKSGYVPEREEWLPLWVHLLDTAAVAEHLAHSWLAPTIGNLLEQEFADSDSGLTATEEFCVLSAWIAAMHDIGKCSPAFASKVKRLDDQMKEYGLNHEHVDSIERRKVPHGLAGHIITKNWLVDDHGWTHGQADLVASLVGAHHGIPPTHASLNECAGREHLIGDDTPWTNVQRELLSFVTEKTGAQTLIDSWSQRSWSLAFLVDLSGLIIVADWIASTEAYFPLICASDDGTSLLDPQVYAKRASLGLRKVELPTPWCPRDDGQDPDSLLASRFNLPEGASSTDIQSRAVEAARSMELPGILIVEESTGGGKTEAALMAAEILAARTGRSGVLFALPTQATTDAMFAREISWLEKIEKAYSHGGAPSNFAVQLTHGRARMNEEAKPLRRRGYEIRDRLLGSLGGGDITEDSIAAPSNIGWDEEEARTGPLTTPQARRRADIAIMSWFSGRKKAMLSDFVVTTIDHLLFGAMRSPHLAMRHLGLSRKVVIVDEVHSYSTYMNVYLDRALTWLAAYGVPVVLLSATLSEARCSTMVQAYRRGLRLASGESSEDVVPESLNTPFPCLITAGRQGVNITETASSGRHSLVRVKRVEYDGLVPLLTDHLSEGGCVLVVRNTVSRAQETYEELKNFFGDDVSLNHARFTLGDRLEKDRDLLNRFGPPRSSRKRPDRAIIVATQVVEQSLDVDFDLLVTDLAPIDLILQRMGRLHRHKRMRPSTLVEPTCYIDCLPSSSTRNPSIEPGAKAIYGEHDMLLSAAALDRVISGSGAITVPDDVHKLIEEVYGQAFEAPPSRREALEQAQEKAAREYQQKQRDAQGFLLEEPPSAGKSKSLVGWLHSTASDDDESCRAQVRDGEDSLEVILLDLRREGGQRELLTLPNAPDAPGVLIPTDRLPENTTIRAMAMSAVRLPPRFTNARTIDTVINELEKHHVSAWQDDPQLRGQLFLPLINNRAELGGVTLEYSPITGLKEVHLT